MTTLDGAFPVVRIVLLNPADQGGLLVISLVLRLHWAAVRYIMNAVRSHHCLLRRLVEAHTMMVFGIGGLPGAWWASSHIIGPFSGLSIRG